MAGRARNAFCAVRPCGHHATQARAMGFCIFNNIAVAAAHAVEGKGLERVAIVDFDVHHGNGTEAILLNRPGTAFFSIHLFPCYPGTGGENVGTNCFNYPVAPGLPRQDYRAALARALGDLKKFRPDLVAVSAGFDAYVRDPLVPGMLVVDDFYWLGQSLRALGVPLFSLLEGGYSRDLPELIFAYLKGVEGK
jgi:acetoin utilization deacetylase AcuC-like enzyme